MVAAGLLCGLLFEGYVLWMRALNGERAFEYILQQQKPQAPTLPPLPAPLEKPGK